MRVRHDQPSASTRQALAQGGSVGCAQPRVHPAAAAPNRIETDARPVPLILTLDDCELHVAWRDDVPAFRVGAIGVTLAHFSPTTVVNSRQLPG